MNQTARMLKQSQSLQAYEILHAGFVIAPLTAGVDKFTNRLTNWDQYLAEQVPSRLGMTPKSFMRLVGAIEISAGIGVALKPKIFGYVVSAWLCGIAGNFLLKRQYLDIALRDVGLALGALALGRLSHQHEGAVRHSFWRNRAQAGLRAVPAPVATEESRTAARAA